MGLQHSIKVIEHDPRFYLDGLSFRIKFKNSVKQVAGINDICLAKNLAAVRCATTSRQNRDTFRFSYVDCPFDISIGHRNNSTDWLYLIDRRVGRIPPPAEFIEQDISFEFFIQPGGKLGSSNTYFAICS